MNIKIDVREKDIIKLIKPLQIDLGLKFNIEILTLPLGDIIIEHEKDKNSRLNRLNEYIKNGFEDFYPFIFRYKLNTNT